MELADPDFLVGKTLQQNYYINELIGEGGMAFVYRATHRILEGDVAIKILQRRYANQDDFRERFLREARLQYQIQHPNIVRVLDFIDDQDLVGCVLEWCNGGELASQKRSPKDGWPLVELEDNFFPLLDGLGLVHQQGYIHRDIKPQNILIQHQKGKEIWKVSDFGLLKDPHAEQLTQSGAIIGTFHYISPEQFQESKEVDCRTDIYSLGVVLYQLLLGRVPFPATMPRLAIQILESPIPFPKDFPSPFRDVLEVALAKNPDDRYENCDAFKQALQSAIGTMREVSSHLMLRSGPLGASSKEQTKTNTPDVSKKASFSNLDKPQPNMPVSMLKGPLDSIVQEPVVDGRTEPKYKWFRPVGLLLLMVMVGGIVWYLIVPKSKRAVVFQKATLYVERGTKTKDDSVLHRAIQMDLAAKAAKRGSWGQTRYLLRHLGRSQKEMLYWYALWIHKTLDIWRLACAKGERAACHWSARAKQKGWKEIRFAKRALPLYQKACKQGEVRGCIALGLFKQKVQPSQAHLWLHKACQLKSSRGCRLLGLWYQRRRTKKSIEQSSISFGKACAYLDPEGCLLQGRLLLRRQSKTFRKRAYIAFGKACRLHDSRGCRLQRTLDSSIP